MQETDTKLALFVIIGVDNKVCQKKSVSFISIKTQNDLTKSIFDITFYYNFKIIKLKDLIRKS